MPQRNFDTEAWGDSFVQKLGPEGKLLFFYLWTNSHCNCAGLYHITIRTIAFETGLAEAAIPPLLEGELATKVSWWPEPELIWVKNFLRHQARTPNFLMAVSKALRALSANHQDIIKAYLTYNQALSIPSPSPIHAIPTLSASPGDSSAQAVARSPSRTPKPKPRAQAVAVPPLTPPGADAAASGAAAPGAAAEIPGNEELLDSERGVNAWDSALAEYCRLHQDNFGVLSPMLVETVKDFFSQHEWPGPGPPASWVREAVAESVKHGKRNWAYTSAILIRWRDNGREKSQFRGKTRPGLPVGPAAAVGRAEPDYNEGITFIGGHPDDMP